MKFSIKDFFSKCDQIRRKLRIWSHLLKKSLMENFIFLCSVYLLPKWIRYSILYGYYHIQETYVKVLHISRKYHPLFASVFLDIFKGSVTMSSSLNTYINRYTDKQTRILYHQLKILGFICAKIVSRKIYHYSFLN